MQNNLSLSLSLQDMKCLFLYGCGLGAWHSEKRARSVLWHLVRLRSNDLPTCLSLMPETTEWKKLFPNLADRWDQSNGIFFVSLMELEPGEFVSTCWHPGEHSYVSSQSRWGFCEAEEGEGEGVEQAQNGAFKPDSEEERGWRCQRRMGWEPEGLGHSWDRRSWMGTQHRNTPKVEKLPPNFQSLPNCQAIWSETYG